jgi:hypothetical protein
MTIQIPHDDNCNACILGKYNGLTENNIQSRAVNSTYPIDLNDTKLIVISSHPGHYEEKYGMLMCPNDDLRKQDKKKNKVVRYRNAGSVLRYAIKNVLDLNPVTQVYYTNIVRCNPKKEKVLEKHIKVCTGKWLKAEILIWSKHIPTVPILVAGTDAVRAMKTLDPSFTLSGVKEARRQVRQLFNTHPATFTTNPASVASRQFRIESYKYGNVITRVEELPPLIGSPMWMFFKDIEVLKDYIK